MTRIVVTLAVLVSCLSITHPAHADASVTPKPKDAAVMLKAGKLSPNRPVRTASAVRRSQPQSTVVYRLMCRINDPLLPMFRCRKPDPRKPAAKGHLSEGAILNAVREIGLPSLTVRIQPGTSTLVNIPTIFYTNTQAFRRSITLLGYDIDLVADPVRYRWSHGDGTTSTTSQPGKPYPSMEVSYRYRKPADMVNPRVDVVYQVRYRVDAGAWSTIRQTLLAPGPAAALEVKEATPVLTAP